MTGATTYEELVYDLALVDDDDIADTIPVEWNHLERYEPGVTKLLHYTVVPTQPWRTEANPLGELWMDAYREAVEAGAIPPEEVEALLAAGPVKLSLAAPLRRAPSRQAVLDRRGARPGAGAPSHHGAGGGAHLGAEIVVVADRRHDRAHPPAAP